MDESAEGQDEDRGAGAPPDLDALYRRLHPVLLRHLRVSHGWQAEDIAADVWVEVVALLPRFEGGDDAFRAWLFTLARRRLIDAYRRTARRPTDPLPADVEGVASEQPEEEALALVAAEAAIAQVHHLLPPDQAEVLLLRIVGGLTVDQVAVITGKRAVNVRVLQHRALRRLASLLGPSLRSA